MVGGATLADVLNDDEARETFADSIDDVLVDTARIDSDALLKYWVILVSLLTFTTKTVDGNVPRQAVAIESVGVEDLVPSASIAVGLEAISNLDCWLAVETGRVTISSRRQ